MTCNSAQIRISLDQALQDRPLVLVVHPSEEVRTVLLSALDFDGFDVMTMADCEQPGIVLGMTPPDVVVTDVRGAGAQSDLVRRAQGRDPSVPVVAYDDLTRSSSLALKVHAGVELVTREEGLGRLLEVLYRIVSVGRALPSSSCNGARISV